MFWGYGRDNFSTIMKHLQGLKKFLVEDRLL
jgi:hypothetical protein